MMKKGKHSPSLPPEAVKAGQGLDVLILLVICAISLFINIYNNSFPLGYHADEPKKVLFIKEGFQDFAHPALMLQAARGINYVAGFTGNEDIAFLGRTVVAITGTLTVFFAYVWSSTVLGRGYSLLMALATAVSPILVVHAHYVKEDIFLTSFSLLSLIMLIRFIKKTDKRTSLWLGAATGLAISSHYKGVLLIAVYVLSPLIVSIKRKGSYYTLLLGSCAVSLLVFFMINYPLILEGDLLKFNYLFELKHAVQGHHLKISPWSFFFGFHFVKSVVPGMTLLLALPAVYYLVHLLVRWKRITTIEDRVLFLFTAVFYFTVEISPLKPFPDHMRYIMPVIPAMIFFAYRGIIALLGTLPHRTAATCALLIIISILLPCYTSVRLVYHLDKDTREKARELIEGTMKKAKFEAYANPSNTFDVVSLAKLNISEEQERNTDYLVASSFVYERVAFGSTLKNQDRRIYEAHKKYEEIFNFPYREIQPAYKSYAFSNPTIRIVNIGNDD